MTQTLLGIDIGTSSCKAALFDLDGHVLFSAKQAYPVYYPQEGWAEQDPEEWWKAVCRICRDVSAKARAEQFEIAGIGLSGQSWSCILIDEQGQVLAPNPIWQDTRSASICRAVNEEPGSGTILELAGNPLEPGYTTGKILWFQKVQPDIYQRTWKILQSNAFIAYRLTGAASQDLSQAYGLHCYDMKHSCWDPSMAEKLGIDLEKLPELVSSDTVIGKVTRKASLLTGLDPDIPVVAGGLDSACGALGAGVIHAGDTQEQGGQSEGMSICLEQPLTDPRLILTHHVIPGAWLLQGGTSGGSGVMRWLEEQFGSYERLEGKKQNRSSLDLYNEAASAVPAGSDGLIFLPYMAGERSPLWNPDAKGVYYGLDFSKTKGHFIRSAMEGVAFSLKHNLDVAAGAGVEVERLKATGGSANSLLWTQIKSDITRCPIDVPLADDSCALGAAMLAGVGTGLYRDYEEAVSRCITFIRFHEPDLRNSEIYEKNYQTYRKLYEQLEGLMSSRSPVS